MEGTVDKIYAFVCGGLYKEYYGSVVTWLVTYPDSKINWFTWSKEENVWIFPGDKYNE